MKTLQSLTDLISLQGKWALISGAATGIGRAIAHRFAEAGAKLHLVDLDAAELARAERELRPVAAALHTYTVDLSNKSEIDQLWAGLGTSSPEILVNNAGIYPFRHFVDLDEAFLAKVMDTNLNSVTWMCHQMITSRRKLGGVVINLGSIEAVQPFKEDLAIYSVSKAGVSALTRALAREHARHGFRINAILPGGIITSGTRRAARRLLSFKFGLLKDGWNFRQRLPAGRFGLADEVARMALVLASDLASYVHGAVIPIDGGFLAA